MGSEDACSLEMMMEGCWWASEKYRQSREPYFSDFHMHTSPLGILLRCTLKWVLGWGRLESIPGDARAAGLGTLPEGKGLDVPAKARRRNAPCLLNGEENLGRGTGWRQ